MGYLKNIIYGMVLGVANIIPGVSGGTIAVVLDIYDRLIASISSLRKEFKKSILFLVPIGLGTGIGIVLFSKLISYLLDNHYMITNFFFIGIIIGSIPMIYKKATVNQFKLLHIIPCIIALGIMLVTIYLVPSTEGEAIIKTLTAWQFIRLTFASAVAAICMIIPGISGSFVMLLFGVYETITTAISDLNILILIPIAIGSLVGILLGSKLIKVLLNRFPQATYFSILGFVLGSIPVIVNKMYVENALMSGGTLVIAILVCMIGIAISYLFSNENFKKRLSTKLKKA